MLSRIDFLPDLLYMESEEGWEAVDRHTQPEQWEKLSVSAEPLVTEVSPAGAQLIPSSSSSGVEEVNEIVTHAAVQPGERVLEVGTGTGYMAYRVHEAGAHVTTVDISPRWVNHARARFSALNAPIHVAVADDSTVWNSTYDAIIATCSVSHIPAAWLSALAPQGRILAPAHTRFGNLGLLHYTHAEESARLLESRWLAFMPHTGAVRKNFGSTVLFEAPHTAWMHDTLTLDALPAELWTHRDTLTWLALHMPDVYTQMIPGETQGTAWLIHPETHSVATLTYTRSSSEVEIRWRGERNLINELVTAYESFPHVPYTQLHLTPTEDTLALAQLRSS